METGDETDQAAPDPRTLRGRRAIARADDQTAYRTRRRQVIDIAARLFREKGYEATTFTDIAREFGTDRASLYYYVTGKDELFQEIVEGILEQNLEEAERIVVSPDSATRKLERLVLDQLDAQASNYPSMYVYIQEGIRPDQAETEWGTRMAQATHRYERIVRQIIREGIEAGEIRGDIDARLLAVGLFGLMSWPHRWFKPGEPFTSSEVARSIVAIFLDGVRTTF